MKINEFQKVSKKDEPLSIIEVNCNIQITELVALLVSAYGNPVCFHQMVSMFGINAEAITQIEDYIESNRYNSSINLKELGSNGSPEQIVQSAQVFKIFKHFAENARHMQSLLEKGE